MKVWLCISLIVIGQLIEYKFYKNCGQIIYDYSKNNHHASNGINSSVDDRDSIFTDRGIYMSATSMIRISDPSISSDIIYPSEFSMVFFLKSLGLQNIANIFVRSDGTKFFKILHDKPNSRLIFQYNFGSAETKIALDKTKGLPTSNLY